MAERHDFAFLDQAKIAGNRIRLGFDVLGFQIFGDGLGREGGSGVETDILNDSFEEGFVADFSPLFKVFFDDFVKDGTGVEIGILFAGVIESLRESPITEVVIDGQSVGCGIF